MIKDLMKLKKYFIFIFGGGIGMLINLGITFALTEYLKLWYGISYAIGLLVNVIFNFFYHRHITFQKKDKSDLRFLRFVIITAGIVVLNWILVFFATEVLGFYYMVSIVVITFIVSVINYLLNKTWAFK